MRTHYDVLNLDKTCSAKDIKDSFIKLSKKFHPDLNKSSDAHKRFVEVNEAYSVLGNSSTRHRYDASLLSPRPPCQNTTHTGGGERHPYEHYAEMYTRYRNRYDTGGVSYITPSKMKLVVFCCMLMVFGSSLQITHIKLRNFWEALVWVEHRHTSKCTSMSYFNQEPWRSRKAVVSNKISAETRRRKLRTQEFARALKEARERTCRIGKEQRLRELKEALLKN